MEGLVLKKIRLDQLLHLRELEVFRALNFGDIAAFSSNQWDYIRVS